MADLSSTGMFIPSHTPSTIPCPTCQSPITPSPTSSTICSRCLSSTANLTSPLPSTLQLIHCPECSSYLQPPHAYLPATLESPQLLSICLHRIRKTLASNSLKLIDSKFLFTEPHSKRIKLHIVIQGQIHLSNVIVQQNHVVEFHVIDHLCDSCSRANANPDQWVAKVQLRQHVPHRRTFFFLEQLLLRHRAADKSIRIVETREGIDFMFNNRSHAVKFVDFVSSTVPVTSRSDKQLVSHDTKSQTYNYRYTFSVEICPICREDIICLPPSMARSLGNIGPVVICTKVTNSLALLDPVTLRSAYLDAKDYWRSPFEALMTSKQMVEYIVLDMDDFDGSEVVVGGTRYRLAYAQVARVSDFGKNDTMFTVRTHLGHLLKPGDNAFGYDMYAANSNNREVEKYRDLVIPDVILMKKSYEEKRQRRRGKARPWKLKSLEMEVDTTTARGRVDEDRRNDDYQKFMDDIEEDPSKWVDMMNLYKNNDYQPSEMASTIGDDDDVPKVPLHLLMNDLDLSDNEEGRHAESDADSMNE